MITHMPNTDQFGFFLHLQDEYVKLFNNSCWYFIINIPVPEVNTAPVQMTDYIYDPPFGDDHKFYECGVNHLRPDCPRL